MQWYEMVGIVVIFALAAELNKHNIMHSHFNYFSSGKNKDEKDSTLEDTSIEREDKE